MSLLSHRVHMLWMYSLRMTDELTTLFNDSERAGDQLAEVLKSLSSIIYAILLRPLCNHHALIQYALLNGKGSNFEAYQREVIAIIRPRVTACDNIKKSCLTRKMWA